MLLWKRIADCLTATHLREQFRDPAKAKPANLSQVWRRVAGPCWLSQVFRLKHWRIWQKPKAWAEAGGLWDCVAVSIEKHGAGWVKMQAYTVAQFQIAFAGCAYIHVPGCAANE